MPMITKTSEILEDWKHATQNLADYFVTKYFGKDITDVHWVADDVGDVLLVNDYFFSLSNMVDYLRYGYPKDKVFEYYDYSLKCIEEEELPINIKNWIKLRKE